MKNTTTYLFNLEAIQKAFPGKEVATFTAVARYLGLRRGDVLRNTPEFPRVTINNKEMVPLRSFAMYMSKGGNIG